MSRRTILVGSAMMLIAVMLPIPALAEEALDRVSALGDSILALRRHAQFAQAAEAARDMLSILELDRASREWEIADAGRLVATLEHASRLSWYEKRELAVADSLAAAIDELLAEGRYSEGVEAAERQLDIRRRLLGEEHPEVAGALNDLTLLLSDQERFVEAEARGREALAVSCRVLGEEHPDVVIALNNLAGVLWDQGDLRGAQGLFQELLAVSRSLFGENHPAVATGLNNLACVLRDKGELGGAATLFRDALRVHKELQGEVHPNVATTLDNLAGVLVARGEFEVAESLYRESLAIRRGLLGEGHFYVAVTLTSLANLLRDHGGNRTEAESLYERALMICEDALGPDHARTARVHSCYADFLQACGNHAAAFEHHREALRIYRQAMDDFASLSSERQSLLYNRKLQHALSGMIDSAVLSEDPSDLVEAAYRELLRVRGALLDRLTSQKKLAIEGAALGQTYMRLVQAGERLSFHVARGPAADHAAYHDQLKDLRSQKEKAERDVARASTRAQEHLALELGEEALGAEEVLDLLPDGSVLVEWVRYTHVEPDSHRTRKDFDAAFLLDPGERSLNLIRIGPAARTDSLVTVYQKHFAGILARRDYPNSWKEKELVKINRALYDLLIRPLGESFASAGLRIMVPDGSLSLVNFGTFVDPQGRYLAEGAPIHLLSTARDLLQPRAPEKAEGLFALGNPDYWATAETRSGATRESNSTNRPAAEPGMEPLPAMRGAWSDWRSISDVVVPRLPGSESEVKEIVELYREWGGGEIVLEVGLEATEDLVKRSAPGHRVVHLATHGFYLNDACETGAAREGFASPVDDDKIFPGENPMLLSGLLFSGSNRHGEGAEAAGIDDGILTALELATMDLRGCDWLVLSACETALGKAEQGEGVYGLRRAAQLAGAQTVIMSVFPVFDEETRGLMRALYRERLTGRSTTESLHRAMRLMMDTAQEEFGNRHPLYWGGFVAVGAWD